MREEEKTDAPRCDGNARIFDVRGRASRSDLGEVAAFFFLACFFLAMVGLFCAALGERTIDCAIGWATAAFVVACLCGCVWLLCGCVGAGAILATSARRLHDAGFSGRWLLLFFFPVVGWAVLAILLLVCPGTKGENRYGAQPEERLFWTRLFSESSEGARRKRKGGDSDGGWRDFFDGDCGGDGGDCGGDGGDCGGDGD